MPTPNTIRSILINIFQHRLLRVFLLISLSVPIFILLRSYFLVLPQFRDKLLIHSEIDAQRTARHISSHFIRLDRDQIVLRKVMPNNIQALMSEFGLEKIKLFSKEGRILFSSDEEEIGTTNDHDYFHRIVAKGKMQNIFVKCLVIILTSCCRKKLG